jgi:hypothetical protein
MKNILKYFPYKSLSAYAVLLTYSAVLIGNMTYQRWTVREVIDWDVTSYYGYLPATFIHNDIELKFVSEDPVGYAKRMEFWPETAENGGKVIKTTMGLSILYSPFFAIAHCIATYGGYSTTGFSAPYQLCIHFASVFYLAFGLIYLRKMLLMLFSETISAIVIVSIVLGTNLFYYATIEASMSHSFNFSLISIFLYLSFKWHERQKLSYTLMIGLIGGLIVLIRPVNIIVFIIPALMNVTSLTTLVRKFQFFWGYRSKILIIM